ncbi:Signal transduction histidine kinase [Chitinophaga costaii]|uniref:Signal transduction histidine kinase n=1 Tax=Chitinophaga costaii TaxID=1335309 RepID=A0A1C4CP86_9BACT|nr:Signal transduction histidine kinase [Chitinophaga costaii]
MPLHTPCGAPAAASRHYIECPAFTVTAFSVGPLPHQPGVQVAVLGFPLLLILTYGQWGIVLVAMLLLVLGLVRLDLLNKRRKDRQELRKMQVEYEAMQHSVIRLGQLETLLRQQMRVQERLITAILHDIKSPLYYLLISARALSSRITSTAGGLQADAAAFYDATYRMYQLLDNLLQYVKLHAQNKHNVQEPIALRALVAEKASIFTNMAAAKNIDIENDIDDSLTLRNDRTMLAIILHNLMDNAIKFTESGTVRITATVKDGQVCLEIADSGVGMHAGWMDWVNQPLSVDTPPYPAENGLGLIIVKELLAEIHGRLKMSSNENGTVAEVIVAYK